MKSMKNIFAILISLLLVSSFAFADGGAPAGQAGSGLSTIIMFAAIFGIFYLLMIRPQQKKQKAQQMMIDQLTAGEHVLLSSGIIGTVSSVQEDGVFIIEIAQGVKVKIVRSGIVDKVNADGTAIQPEPKKKDKKEKEAETKAEEAKPENSSENK